MTTYSPISADAWRSTFIMYHPRDTENIAALDWEPLDWAKNPPNPGDEVRCIRHAKGVVFSYCGTVHHLDEEGDPITEEGGIINLREAGNWYVRRKKDVLPTDDGSVIVPAEGQDWIVVDIDGTTHNTKRLTLTQSKEGLWYWIGLSHRTGNPFAAYPEDIVPGTWLDTTR